jgi:hypothetical protein
MVERCTERRGDWRCDLQTGHTGEHVAEHIVRGKRSSRRWADPPGRGNGCIVCEHRSAVTHFSLIDQGIDSCIGCGRILLDTRKKQLRDAQEADAKDLLYSLGAP